MSVWEFIFFFFYVFIHLGKTWVSSVTSPQILSLLLSAFIIRRSRLSHGSHTSRLNSAGRGCIQSLSASLNPASDRSSLPSCLLRMHSQPLGPLTGTQGFGSSHCHTRTPLSTGPPSSLLPSPYLRTRRGTPRSPRRTPRHRSHSTHRLLQVIYQEGLKGDFQAAGKAGYAGFHYSFIRGFRVLELVTDCSLLAPLPDSSLPPTFCF